MPNAKYTRPRRYNRRKRSYKRKSKTVTKSKIDYNVGQVVKTNHRKNILVRRMSSLFPDRAIIQLDYKDVITLSTSTPGIANNYVFRINSLFDPDYTGTGVQCMGYDQWSMLYEKYHVSGLAYDFNCYTANTVPSNLCVYPTDNSTLVSTSVQDISMQPGASKIVSITPDNSQCRLKGYCTPNSVLGLTKSQYKDSVNYSATTGTNPSGVAFLHLCMQPMDETSSTSITVNVSLRYYAQMYDRVELGPS